MLKIEGTFSWLSSWWFILLVLNAFIGIYLLEFVWKRTARFRKPPSQELEDLFPAFRRKDALRWQKWRLIPGAMFLLVPRLLGVPLFFAINVFSVKILMCGHKEGTPLKGCRKALIRFIYNVCWRIVGVFSLSTYHTYVYIR
jgi:hypothetical protein